MDETLNVDGIAAKPVSRRTLLTGAVAGLAGQSSSALAAGKPSTDANKAGELRFDGKVIWRGEPGYSEVLDQLVWNVRKPGRQPRVIVVAANSDDVARAVRLAKQHGLKVKALAGGHSWSGSGVRQDSMLVYLGRLNTVSIDAERSLAVVGPGCPSVTLMSALEPHGLFFPTAHCSTVAMGGFLLQGGWGWNSRTVGTACMSVRAIDVVTPEGSIVHSSATENPEYLWAARGAGAGFFGIVTRYYLACHERPRLMLARVDTYPAEVGPEVVRWALSLQDHLPNEIEWGVNCRRPTAGAPVEYSVGAISYIADEKTAQAALAVLDTCPVFDKATSHLPPFAITMAQLFTSLDEDYKGGLRWSADNIWTDVRSEEVVQGLIKAAEVLPPAPSHLVFYGWPKMAVPDSAFSMYGRLFACALAAWEDPTEDATLMRRPTEALAPLFAVAKGMGLADENMRMRDAKVLASENMERLERYRKRFDPEGRFLSYFTKNAAA